MYCVLFAGDWQALNADTTANNSIAKVSNTIILGSGVAKKLNVVVGDDIQLLLPAPKQAKDVTQVFTAPVTTQVKVVGIFKFGGTIDDSLAYISLEQARILMGYDANQTQSIRLRVDNVFEAPAIVRTTAYNFNHYVYINDWTRTQGHIFNDIQLVRLVMFIVLVLVIAVASFNIVSTLIMAVNEKKGDIAILKTMGASAPVIMFSFIIQGVFNGIVGSLVGGVLGIYLALNLVNLNCV